MKYKSSKITKLEKNRFSILADNLEYCYVCGRPSQALHEVYEGAYRLRSMEYGCVLPLCNECHNRIHNDTVFKLYYKRKMKDRFEETYDTPFNELFYFKEKER